MSQYRAPLAEMQFVMTELAGLDEIAQLPGFEDATPETVAAILEEADKFATEVLDPLNRIGRSRGRASRGRRPRDDAAGIPRRIPQVLRAGLERPRRRAPNSAARACRSSSPPRSTRCGTRRTWRSSCARC